MAGLGFGTVVAAGTGVVRPAGGARVPVEGFCPAILRAGPAPFFAAADVAGFPCNATFFGTAALRPAFLAFAPFNLTWVLATGRLTPPGTAFGLSLLSVISNAGLGTARPCGARRVTSAAGFTPAATAALAAAGVSDACFTVPCMSAFTMIWLTYRRSTDSSF